MKYKTQDKLIRATAKDDNIRIIAASTTNLVNEAVRIHKCAPTAAAAFGRMLTAGSIMGAMLKSSQDSLTVKISGNGIAGGILVTSYADGHVKGYIGNPSADLPPNDKGKLDVGGIIGTEGNLTIIRDMGLKEPYSSQIPIQTGEIGLLLYSFRTNSFCSGSWSLSRYRLNHQGFWRFYNSNASRC